MKNWIGWVVLFFLPSFSWAQTVTVVAGEHANFSRLVVQFEQAPEWEFGQVEGGYELRSDVDVSDWDFTEVFELIPRTRIAAVTSPGPGRVFLQVSCDCSGDAFEIRQGRLVIDIKDQVADENSLFEQYLSPVADGLGWLTSEGLDVALADVDPSESVLSGQSNGPVGQQKETHQPTEINVVNQPIDPVSPHPFQRITDAPRQSVLWHQAPASGLKSLPPSLNANELSFLETVQRSPRVVLSEQILLEQLGRAATQGLIMVDLPDTVDLLTGQNRLELGQADTPDKVEKSTQTASFELQDLENLHVETAFDRGANFSPGSTTLTSDGLSCLAENLFEFTAWGSSGDGAAHLSDLRARLILEFDKPNQLVVEELVKRYLFLGFGAEAAQLMRVFEVDILNSALFFQLADVLDATPFADSDILRSQLTCSTPAVLWAVLASDTLPPGADIDENAVLRAFSGLPEHLRHHLAPDLVTRFLAFGNDDVATAIRDIADRTVSAENLGFQMVEAQIAAYDGDLDKALVKLLAVASSAGASGPEALATLIESQLEAGRPVEQKAALFADAMAAEFSETEMGIRLTKAAIRGYAISGEIETAFERIESALAGGDLALSEAARLAAETHLRNAQSASIPDFLSVVYRYQIAPGIYSDVAISARRAIAHRLQSLGLPLKARQIFSLPTEILNEDDKNMLAAIELDLGKPIEARQVLADQYDEKSIELQARALEMSQDFQGAGQLYEQLGLTNDRDSAFWRAKDWQAVAISEPSARSEIAQLAVKDELAAPNAAVSSSELLEISSPNQNIAQSESSENQGPLAISKQLLETSISTRSVVTELLVGS